MIHTKLINRIMRWLALFCGAAIIPVARVPVMIRGILPKRPLRKPPGADSQEGSNSAMRGVRPLNTTCSRVSSLPPVAGLASLWSDILPIISLQGEQMRQIPALIRCHRMRGKSITVAGVV